MKISDLPKNSETYNSYYKTYKAKYCRKIVNNKQGVEKFEKALLLDKRNGTK